MSTELELLAAARDALSAAGYPLVLNEFELPRLGKRESLDVLAFDADSSGALLPAAAVEVKLAYHSDDPSVLDQLALWRGRLGTREHYLVTPEGWHRADPGLRSFSKVDGPARAERPRGELRDPDLAHALITKWLWRAADRRRSETSRPFIAALHDVLLLAPDGVAAIDDETLPIAPDVLWHVVRDAVRQAVARDTYMSQHLSAPNLVGPLARLFGDPLPTSVCDPFAGIGSLLWAVADRAVDEGVNVRLSGIEINSQVEELANAVAARAPLPITVGRGDALRAQPSPVAGVISQPPIGLHLGEQFELSNGESTRDGDLAVIDACLSRLLPGGRAVLQLGRGWTQRGGQSGRYRSYLSDAWRIGALIGLPAGAIAGTSIPSLIAVIDRAEPTTTFVAQLEANWADDLGPDGQALRDCLQHLGPAGSSGNSRPQR